MYKFGFIGMGNMGSAMLKGAMKSFGTDSIAFSEPNKEKMSAISGETGAKAFDSNVECVKNCKYVILAVKPNVYPTVLDEIKSALTEDHVIVSIAPGMTTVYLSVQTGSVCKIVRAMPNTPAMVGEGMTAISFDKDMFSEEEVETVTGFFKSFGRVEIIEERLMNAAVCASGSSPAYVYMFIEALADSVVKCGMPRNKAYEFVAQTVLGSAKMVLETGMHPGKLKDDVCSPGGTTIAGVEKLEENGLRNSLFKATEACYNRCEGK